MEKGRSVAKHDNLGDMGGAPGKPDNVGQEVSWRREVDIRRETHALRSSNAG